VWGDCLTINVDGVLCNLCGSRMRRSSKECVKKGDVWNYFSQYSCANCVISVTLFRRVDFGRIERNIKVRR
jgi:hypothetical protein